LSERPFRLLGPQQIALGALDRSRLRALWVERFGLSSVDTYRSQSENVDEEILRLGEGPGALEVDLMQPLDPEGRPRVHEPGLNHVGFWVDDLHMAVCWLVAHEVRIAPGGIRKGAGGHEVCFIHPKPSAYFPVSGEGVLIELVQAPPDVIRALGSRAS
jgi:lactoylglutathione lyase